MMYTEIIMTAGISLFSGNNFFGSLTREKDIFKFQGSNPIPNNKDSIDKEIKEWIQIMEKDLGQTLGSEERISAEYSMVWALKKKQKLRDKPKIVLLHTDTFGGKAAALLNKMLLEKDFAANVSLSEIKGLDITSKLKLSRSLGNFMALVNKHLEDKYKDSVCFAPIGGYKIFTSLGHIITSFNNIPMAYLHEDAQIIHEIPAIPITYDDRTIQENAEFLRKFYLEEILYENTLSYLERQFIKTNNHLFEQSGNMVALNPFGFFICEQEKFQHIFGVKVFVSNEVTGTIEKYRSEKEFIYRQIQQLANKVAEKPSDADLYHDREFKAIDKGDSQYHLYKGTSHGVHVFRATWRYDDKSKHLFINYIWLDHDLYEREIIREKGFLEGSCDFPEISKEIYSV